MENKELKQIACNWKSMVDTVLNLEKVSLSEMQNLLKETYIKLIAFHKEELIPKEITKILLEMDSFLYFASLMEDKELGIGFYNYQCISSVVTALKKGFFEANYFCDFPKLKIQDSNENELIINFETNIFKNITDC